MNFSTKYLYPTIHTLLWIFYKLFVMNTSTRLGARSRTVKQQLLYLPGSLIDRIVDYLVQRIASGLTSWFARFLASSYILLTLSTFALAGFVDLWIYWVLGLQNSLQNSRLVEQQTCRRAGELRNYIRPWISYTHQQ